jgi:hypothetical protein
MCIERELVEQHTCSTCRGPMFLHLNRTESVRSHRFNQQVFQQNRGEADIDRPARLTGSVENYPKGGIHHSRIFPCCASRRCETHRLGRRASPRSLLPHAVLAAPRSAPAGAFAARRPKHWGLLSARRSSPFWPSHLRSWRRRPRPG